MKINKIQGTKDFNYSNEELEKDELYINGNRSGGVYNLNVRTNKLKYEICLLNINEGREKLSVTLIYDENMLREGLNKVTRLNVESFLTYDEAKDAIIPNAATPNVNPSITKHATINLTLVVPY